MVGSADRAPRNLDDRAVVLAWWLLPIRGGRSSSERRLHGLATPSLGVRRDGASLRRRARPSRCHRRVRGRRMRPDDRAMASRCRRTRTELPRPWRCWRRHRLASGRGTSSPRGTRTNPASSNTSRTALFGEFADANVHKIQHNNAVLDASRFPEAAPSSTPGAPTGRTASREATRSCSASRGTSWSGCPRDDGAAGSPVGRVRRGVPRDRRPGGRALPAPGALHAGHAARRRLTPDQPVRARLLRGPPDPRHDVAEPQGARPPP